MLSSMFMEQVGVGLTIGEQRAHFALWSLYKSPLLISADLRVIDPQVCAVPGAGRRLLSDGQSVGSPQL